MWPRGWGRGIALLFHDRGTRREARPGRTLSSGERPGTHFTGSWVGPRSGVKKYSAPCTESNNVEMNFVLVERMNFKFCTGGKNEF